jgi:hypothetical protein
MLEEIMCEQMPLYSPQIVRVDIELLWHNILFRILPHLQVVNDLPLLRNWMSPFRASILEVQLIHGLQTLYASHILSSIPLLALFMLDLAARHHLAKQSLKKPLMLGLLWRLSRMEESAACSASM